MLDEVRKMEIRIGLAVMAKASQYASALMWLSSLPMDEEDYGREVMESVQRTRGGHVSIAKVWDKPEIDMPVVESFSAAAKQLMDALTRACEAIASFGKVFDTLSAIDKHKNVK